MISAANAIQVTFYVDKTLKGAKLGDSQPIRRRSVCAELRSILVARADGVIEYSSESAPNTPALERKADMATTARMPMADLSFERRQPPTVL
jgi:hypothetical protein